MKQTFLIVIHTDDELQIGQIGVPLMQALKLESINVDKSDGWIYDIERLVSIIRAAPMPMDKSDSQLAQEYRNWFYGIRVERLKASEAR